MFRSYPALNAARGLQCGARLALMPVLVLSTTSWAERTPSHELPTWREAPASASDGRMISQQVCGNQRVSRNELRLAMAQHGDYDILATTNRGRFSTELILRLARDASERDPNGGPLFIEPEDWFHAYIETAGVSEAEAPLPSRLGFENRQRVMIEYRQHRVLDKVEEGPDPTLALNVRAWWESDENPASRFSFTDTTTTPKLKVTSRREITYRLLEFEDMVVVDKVEGVSGRPVSGVLGTLFSIIGEGDVKQSRIALSNDGVQITRARSKKIFSITVTASIGPDGTAMKGLPPNRPDLEEIEERLNMPLKIDYVPYEWVHVCPVERPRPSD